MNRILNNYPSIRTLSSTLTRSIRLHRQLCTLFPSTRHSLPLPGTNHTVARHQLYHSILNRFSRIVLPPHASYHPHDLTIGANAVFLGVGTKTNWPAVHAAMNNHVFQTRRLVVVRDVFDRHPSRHTLATILSFVGDDVVAVLKPVMSGISRRLVNEYIWLADTYRLVKSDICLIEYLHQSGIRVIPVSTPDQLDRLSSGKDPIPVQQSTNHVLACAPTAFRYNAHAAADNHFMNTTTQTSSTANNPNQPSSPSEKHIQRAVLTEFACLHAALIDRSRIGAHVHLFTHEDFHSTPDACFPNNTFSTHNNLETGSSCVLFLYPMKAPTRRKERRLVKPLLVRGRYTQIYDFTREETAGEGGKFLEGTGSLVLDRINRIAYVAYSQRSDPQLAARWCQLMNYTLVGFDAVDAQNRPIYHTNVMMSIGTRVAIVCLESITDNNQKAMVRDALKQTGHTIVEISQKQVEAFCGNVLELESFYGEQVLVMSTGAYNAFGEKHKEALLSGVVRLVHEDISTIERVGGGGVRCTIAELH